MIHLILTFLFSFISLGAYLEWGSPIIGENCTHAPKQTVVRSQHSVINTVTANTSATRHVPRASFSTISPSNSTTPQPFNTVSLERPFKRALNLSVPNDIVEAVEIVELPSPSLTLKPSIAPIKKIRYNAELVYDAEEGKKITGGKVNIKIPFG